MKETIIGVISSAKKRDDDHEEFFDHEEQVEAATAFVNAGYGEYIDSENKIVGYSSDVKDKAEEILINMYGKLNQIDHTEFQSLQEDSSKEFEQTISFSDDTTEGKIQILASYFAAYIHKKTMNGF